MVSSIGQEKPIGLRNHGEIRPYYRVNSAEQFSNGRLIVKKNKVNSLPLFTAHIKTG